MVVELPSSTSKVESAPPVNPIFIQIDLDNARNTQGLLSYGVNEGRRMVKNVTFLSVSIFLIFVAYRNMTAIGSNLSSSRLYYDNFTGLSTFLFSLLVAIFSTLFLPTVLIRGFKTKVVIFVGIIGYTLYVAMQFYWTSFTINIAQVIVNLCSVPLWVATCTYLSHIGHEHASLKSTDPQLSLVRFFGIFFFFYQICGVLGPLISALVYKPEKNDYNYYYPWNETDYYDDQYWSNNCENYKSGYSYQVFDYSFITYYGVESGKLYIVAGFCVVCALAAALILHFRVDSLERYGERRREKRSAWYLFFATVIQLKNPKQLALIPLTIWMSVQHYYFTVDFMRLVRCAWNAEPHAVQYIMICYGVAAALSSASISHTIRHICPKYGRLCSMALATIIHVCLITTLLAWEPKFGEGQKGIVPIAFFWGIADGIWLVEVNALYGVLFHKKVPEAGYTHYELWNFIGSLLILGIFYQYKYQLYFLIGTLGLGVLGYLAVEQTEQNKNL